MKNNFDKAKEAVMRAEKIAVISHISPDGDTLGAGGALTLLLRKLGKDAEWFCDDKVLNKLDFLYSADNIRSTPTGEHYDLAIAVDISDVDRMGAFYDVFRRAKTRICIDHHKSNTFFADITLLSKDSASCSEFMFGFLSELGSNLIDAQIASLLYAGIISDSGAFYYPSTSSETLTVAAGLMEYGIDSNYIYYKLFKNVSPEKFRLQHRVLARAEFYDDCSIAVITFFRKDFAETNSDVSMTEGAISQLQDIEGVSVSVAITEVTETSFKVSLRSKGEIDVSVCASFFGGGGHKNASGFRVNGRYYDVLDKVLKAVRDVL